MAGQRTLFQAIVWLLAVQAFTAGTKLLRDPFSERAELSLMYLVILNYLLEKVKIKPAFVRRVLFDVPQLLSL